MDPKDEQEAKDRQEGRDQIDAILKKYHCKLGEVRTLGPLVQYTIIRTDGVTASLDVPLHEILQNIDSPLNQVFREQMKAKFDLHLGVQLVMLARKLRRTNPMTPQDPK